AGSVTATLLDNKTLAYIDGGAVVNRNDATAAAVQLVRLFAWDNTEILGLAGAVSPSLLVGIGGSADGGPLKKGTEGYLGSDADVDSNTDVEVRAVSDESIISFPITVGVGLAAGIAAQVAIFSLEVKTRAYITDRAKVHANNNVFVLADDESELDLIVG